ncbi:MAG: tetratricopeptide repeat protein [Myxococcota bacterium]|nr:tetratricopeptide repeat protein [Myxococcota bacterium]
MRTLSPIALLVLLLLAAEGRPEELAPEALDALVQVGLRHNADGDYPAANAVWDRLRELAPDHPAAHVHAVDTLYWQDVHVDDGSRFDEPILREAETAVRKALALVERRPHAPLSHFYLGQARIQLGRLHGTRMRFYKAGSLGESGRESLERAQALDPTLADAAFPLGLYQYYASFAPRLLSFLEFLWFIPKGDAEAGLGNLAHVSEQGLRYRFDARFFLGNIQTYHDGREDLDEALRILRGLRAEHPSNALVHFELLELLMMLERPAEAAHEAERLEAHPGLSTEVRGRVNMARVWRARAELAQGRPDRAWTLLESFGEVGPVDPDWGARWVQVVRGQVLDVGGRREEALQHYRRVADLELGDDSRARQLALAGLERPYAQGR